MTDQERKAMEIALDALELERTDDNGNKVDLVIPAIEALRQALEQPDMGIDRGAWDGVEDVTQWLEELRGNEED